MHKYRNPVIRGYNPDPSFCRVGEDYYLVTSSFEFFPGVPIYHSKNLVDWEMSGHCLTGESQLSLRGCRNSGGIYAPTIRWHDGVFYMTTTNVAHKGNFIVHTKDIRGPWSEPAWVEQDGIDPSLLFDDDGKVYFCSTCNSREGHGIALCQLNPVTGKKLTDSVLIHCGAGGRYPEAPHLYKRGGYYYLMMAEGGTEYGHMETIFRAKSPYGPYEPCPRNPILSHRDYGDSPIQATGHADLLEDQYGNWWLCCLGIRPIGHVLLHNLGRETFLAPVVWDADGWPIVGDNGRIAPMMQSSLPAAPASIESYSFDDDFQRETLRPQWTFVRRPRREAYRFGNGTLTITAGPETLCDLEPYFVGVRQPEFCVAAETKLSSELPGEKPMAGLTAYYNNNYHYEIYITRENSVFAVELRKTVHDISVVTARQIVDYAGGISFKIEANQKEYTFFYKTDGDWVKLGVGATAGLCTESTMEMTFTGAFIGLFASGTTAGFEGFSMREIL